MDGSAPRTPIAQHSTFQESAPQTTPVTETRPTAYTESRSVEGGTSGGPAGLPSGYAARGVNPDNVNVNYAGGALFHNDCAFHSASSLSACVLVRGRAYMTLSGAYRSMTALVVCCYAALSPFCLEHDHGPFAWCVVLSFHCIHVILLCNSHSVPCQNVTCTMLTSTQLYTIAFINQVAS